MGGFFLKKNWRIQSTTVSTSFLRSLLVLPILFHKMKANRIISNCISRAHWIAHVSTKGEEGTHDKSITALKHHHTSLHITSHHQSTQSLRSFFFVHQTLDIHIHQHLRAGLFVLLSLFRAIFSSHIHDAIARHSPLIRPRQCLYMHVPSRSGLRIHAFTPRRHGCLPPDFIKKHLNKKKHPDMSIPSPPLLCPPPMK